MNQKTRRKICDLITILLLQLVLTLPFYTANVYALIISNAGATKVTSNSATIEWNTNNISNGIVKYGKTNSLGFTQRHDNFVENHSLTVSNGIDSDTAYLFAVQSTDLAGNTATDNNSNNFYTFRTADITPPSQVTGLKALSATPNSIFLSWNNINAADLNHYMVYRNNILIANSTANSFNDTSLEQNKNFNYKVSAVDSSNNEGSKSDTLIVSTSSVDSEYPIISNVDVLTLTDATARVTWLTDENSTTAALYGINKTDKTKSSEEFKTNHSIVIDGLVKGIEYTLTVKSCDASNNCANSSNHSFIAGQDITPPFINLSIPRFFNRRVIDITGSTEPFSSVTLFVNNMNIPKLSLGNNDVSSGKFIFSQIQLEQDNVIKIVIIDKSGNKNEKSFEISIDTQEPAVQLNNVNSLISNSNLTIKGTVNKPVAINVFVDAGANESYMPSKITGLNTTKVGQNSIELRWQESKDKDFSHYVVYRDGVPIAVTNPASFNLFIDALVDSGKSYTYEISAVNILGKESPRSNAVTAKTLGNGLILNLQHAPVDIFEDFRKPSLNLNASGSFDFAIKLDKGDKTYKIKLIFEDMAGNKAVIEKTLALDTKRPEVKITSPPAGAFIFENVANEIDVIGKTEPNARVHLFVDRTPLNFFNASFDISGLPNEVQGLIDAIKEEQLDAKCRLVVASRNLCSAAADRSVTADGQGNFKFEKVDLTAALAAASRIREVQTTELRDIQLLQEAKETKKATLVVIATDQVGLRGIASQSIGIGTCWSGNQSWDIIPLTKFQGPTLISTERLVEGTERLFFYFNYSYIGRGTNAKITDVSLQKACSAREEVDPRFNISCQILPSGGPVVLNKPNNDISYSEIQLNRFPNMDKFVGDDWKNFFKLIGVNKDMVFPFKARITYEHDITDENGVNKRIKETQTTCEQVSYAIDSTLLDPRKLLGNWVLYNFVDRLQGAIKVLTELQEKIDKAVDYVAFGCLISFGTHLVITIYRTWVQFADEKLFLPAQLLNLQSANPECAQLIGAVKEKYGSLKLKYFSDADLKKCFAKSYSAWQLEAKTYQLQRWSCDRIFGHAAPSKWTEKENDEDLHRKITTQKSCNSDVDTKGLVLRAVKCRSIKLSTYGEKPENFGIDDKCFEAKSGNDNILYTLGEPEGDTRIYRLNLGSARRATSIYAIKQTENQYLTAQTQSCDELCGVNTQDKKQTVIIDGRKYTVQKGKFEAAKPQTDLDKIKFSACVTVNECREWNARANPDKGGIEIPGIGTIKDYSVQRKGYASKISNEDSSPCFYDGTDVSVISETDANTRRECCCVSGKSAQSVSIYYQPDDIDTKLPPEFQKPVHELKSSAGSLLEQSVPDPNAEDDKRYANMKWSYRYWKEFYLNKKYNPNRYIEGRDLPACFGQDSLFYKPFGKEKEILVVDPFKQHTAALQCAYLTGVSQRLQLMKNIMTAMSNCLIQIRKDGRADAGVCKELFTQHVCGLIWQGIRFFVDGCTPEDLAYDVEDKENGIADTVRKGLKGITQGISETQQELSNEYGNVKLNNLLGTGESGIARKACLAAFGYDWDFNIRNLVDAAYSTPFATLVQAVTRSREFLTVNPVTLKPKYEYRASWLINPGCDLENYKVELACVSRKELDEYPNSINCGALGAGSLLNTGKAPFTGSSTGYNQCDCLELPQEKTRAFLTESGGAKQNALIEKDRHDVFDDDYRYDHLKFTLRTDRRILPNVKPNCFPTGYDKGVFYFPLTDKTARDITDCTVQPLSGVFSCGGGASFFSRKGNLQLVSVTINGDNANNVKELTAGEPLRVGARVTKTGQDKCFKVSVTPDAIEPQYTGISINGTSDIPEIEITSGLRIATRTGDVDAKGLSHRLIAQNNQDIVYISAKFFDNGDKIYDDNDKISIDGAEIFLTKGEVQGNEKTRVEVKDRKINIQKGGAIIELGDVQYTQNRAGTYELQTVITIYPQQQATQASQQKTILVEIFNTKEDRDAYSSPDDCNLNDKLLEKLYKVVVSQKGTDASNLGPTIKGLAASPSRQIIGSPVIISARIEHPLKIEKAEISIKKEPDDVNRDGKDVVADAPMESDGDIYKYVFDTVGMEKGKYNGFVKAVSKRNTVTQKNTESSLRFQFELIDIGTAATTTPSAPTPAVSALPTTPIVSAAKEQLMGLSAATTSGLRTEVQSAFNLMKDAAAREGITLILVLGYRSFNNQLDIWNNKFNSLSGTEQNKVIQTAQFNAVPGLSRHHFGTDIDINSVNPNDFGVNGKYTKVYEWLRSNAARFGFCQPYDGTSNVVSEERWHWSYKPISKQLTAQHMSGIFENDLRSKGIQGQNTIISNFDFYHTGFISDINPECLS